MSLESKSIWQTLDEALPPVDKNVLLLLQVSSSSVPVISVGTRTVTSYNETSRIEWYRYELSLDPELMRPVEVSEDEIKAWSNFPATRIHRATERGVSE